MKRSRTYPQVIRRWYRPSEHQCPVCQRTLRQALTLTRRTVITLEGVIKFVHAGYRCPDPQWLDAVQRPADLSSEEQETLAQLRDLHSEVGQAYVLVLQFAHLLRTRTGEQLDAWLERVRASKMREF